MNLMLLMGVFNLDETGRWIDPGVIDANLLRQYLSDIGASQDSLSGVDRLPTFEQLSGGRSVEAIQQMGDQDLNRENAEQGVAGEDARNRAGGGYTIPGSSNAYHVAETNEQYAEKFYEARDEETLRRRAEALERENDSTGENPGVLTLFNVDDDEETGDDLPAVASTIETVRR